MTTIELAKKEGVDLYYKIIEDGRQFQKEQGFVQWTDNYPSLDIINKDIEDAKGYVIKVDGEIAGYLCIDFTREPAYEEIDGAWSVEDNYAVVHRLAFAKAFIGIGLANVTFPLIEKVCISRNVNYIRIDTDFPNKRMQHILEKNGFTKCGVVVFESSEKIAYDKILDKTLV